MTNEEYANIVIERELLNIMSIEWQSVGHPNNGVFACMLRIASVSKGAGLSQGEIGAKVVGAAMNWAMRYHKQVPVREFWRQWRNAYRHASPRARRQ